MYRLPDLHYTHKTIGQELHIAYLARSTSMILSSKQSLLDWGNECVGRTCVKGGDMFTNGGKKGIAKMK